jgi:hypothetical protein
MHHAQNHPFQQPEHAKPPLNEKPFPEFGPALVLRDFFAEKPAARIHASSLSVVDFHDPMSATATTNADAVAAGLWPKHNCAAMLLMSGDSTQ